MKCLYFIAVKEYDPQMMCFSFFRASRNASGRSLPFHINTIRRVLITSSSPPSPPRTGRRATPAVDGRCSCSWGTCGGLLPSCGPQVPTLPGSPVEGFNRHGDTGPAVEPSDGTGCNIGLWYQTDHLVPRKHGSCVKFLLMQLWCSE